jgi:drug/metabolite transporter (DMT)-like permease
MKATGFTVERRGIPLALGAAALFGLSTPFAKILIGSTRPQLVAGLLYLGSGVRLGSYWVLTRSQRSDNETPLTRTDLPWLAGAIMTGGIIAPLLLMLGLSRT